MKSSDDEGTATAEARLTIPHPITLLHGKGAALACGRRGELEPDKLHGLFAGDTRVLSTYNIQVNGCAWHFLRQIRHGRGTAEWTFENPKLRRSKVATAEGTLFLRHLRRIHGAMHDDLTIRNYGASRARFRLELSLEADFSDIFEVKNRSRTARRRVRRERTTKGLLLVYERKDFQRAIRLSFEPSQGRPRFKMARLRKRLWPPLNCRATCLPPAWPWQN